MRRSPTFILSRCSRWIARRGGLTKKLIMLRGAEFVPPLSAVHEEAASCHYAALGAFERRDSPTTAFTPMVR
jgi:hypothetical protein